MKQLRDMDAPTLHRDTLTPVRTYVETTIDGDYGADPFREPDGHYRMVPSGDVVDLAERNRRLAPKGGRS